MARSSKKDKGSKHAALIESVAKKYGSDYIGTFVGDDPIDLVEEWVPSSNHALNYIMGDPRKGAFPMGRVTELFGKKSSAKSLILYDAGANVQKMNGIFVLIDTESAFSKPFGQYLGIDFKRFIYAHLKTIEEVTDFIVSVIERIREKDSSCPILIGWDSMAAGTTLKEEEEDDEGAKSEMGWRAKLMSRQMRRVSGLVYQENITYVVVNQIRKRIGIMFGSPITTPGGEAVPFHSSVRLQVTKTKRIKRSKKVIGHRVLAYCEKNRVRPPFGQCELNIYVDRPKQRYGLDPWSGLVEVLVADGILIKKKGSKICSLAADSKVTFPARKISEYWEDTVLPAIPEDLYAGTGDPEGEEEMEEEDE
jgi:recombination protein RecA